MLFLLNFWRKLLQKTNRSIYSFQTVEKSASINSPPIGGLLLLWLLACLLAVMGLGDLPLRDFDEATVARVAFELSQKLPSEWILPTLFDGEYLNKPPGLHWMIAVLMKFTANSALEIGELPSEFVVRFVPALLSTFVVPLGGLIQWHLLPGERIASLATGSILLTLLPIARHGRLAMLDGPQLTAIALLWLFLLMLDGSEKDRLNALVAGFASSSMLLLKAPLFIPAIFAAGISMLWGGGL